MNSKPNEPVVALPVQGGLLSAEDVVRVLVVEDNADTRQMFEIALAERGCVVRAAEHGRMALAMLMCESFDVLVVDLHMHEMDGLVFLQEALRVWPWVGVVIASAFIDDDAAATVSALGVTRILTKPFAAALLCDNVLAESEVRRQHKVDIPRNIALTLMHDHLKLLTRIGHRTLGMDSLLSALQEFGKELASMMPSDVLGILVIEDEERDLLLTAQHSVSQQFIAGVEDEIFSRYQALSGRVADRSLLQTRMQGAECTPDGPTSIASSLSVPVLVENDIRGLLTLASHDRRAYTSADVSLLYHAANHISALFVALRRMHQLATRDHLTGAFNRIRLEDELQRAWLMSRRYGFSMAAIVVDIDNFKTLNDSYGHSVGDDVLRDFYKLMRRVARASDIIARYGGDEFVAILPRAEETDALAFGERFINALRHETFCSSSLRLSVSSSVGIASSLNRTAPATGDELLRQADRALFMAKRAGRNRIYVWPAQIYAVTDAPSQSGAGERAIDAPAPAVASTTTKAKDYIVVVDDEPSIRELVRMMLAKDGHEVAAYGDANSAIEFIKSNPGRCDILLTDLALPGKSGIDLLHEITPIDDSIIKIVMTGYATVDAAVNCLREGTYDFIQKPVRHGQLSALIRRAIEYRYLRLENSRYQMHLEDMVRKRSEQLAQSLEEVKKSYQFTLEAMVGLLDARERQAGQHSLRTRDLAVYLAQKMGITGEALDGIATGAFLHDIGKIGIPDEILLKKGPLSQEEWEIMKQHAEIGYRILRSSPQLRNAAEIVRTHHEHFDGSGYPGGLKGSAISLGARIFTVIDAYDSMRSNRVYRGPLPVDSAVSELLKHSGTQFDPEVVKAFMQAHTELERILTGQIAEAGPARELKAGTASS